MEVEVEVAHVLLLREAQAKAQLLNVPHHHIPPNKQKTTPQTHKKNPQKNPTNPQKTPQTHWHPGGGSKGGSSRPFTPAPGLPTTGQVLATDARFSTLLAAVTAAFPNGTDLQVS